MTKQQITSAARKGLWPTITGLTAVVAVVSALFGGMHSMQAEASSPPAAPQAIPVSVAAVAASDVTAWDEFVENELRWLGRELGGARDAQVLRERLRLLLSTQPPELVMGPVDVLVDDELGVAEQRGRAQAIETLGGTRYARLVDGPTQADAYVLQIPAARRELALATLRARHEIVLAQPIDGAAR